MTWVVPLIWVAWASEFDSAHSTTRTNRLPLIEGRGILERINLAFRILDSGGDDSIYSSCELEEENIRLGIDVDLMEIDPQDSRRGGN
jgi:hypothetical protein